MGILVVTEEAVRCSRKTIVTTKRKFIVNSAKAEVYWGQQREGEQNEERKKLVLPATTMIPAAQEQEDKK